MSCLQRSALSYLPQLASGEMDGVRMGKPTDSTGIIIQTDIHGWPMGGQSVVPVCLLLLLQVLLIGQACWLVAGVNHMPHSTCGSGEHILQVAGLSLMSAE